MITFFERHSVHSAAGFSVIVFYVDLLGGGSGGAVPEQPSGMGWIRRRKKR